MSRNNRGFTLVELLLSMSFISVLLMAIAMTILQIGETYNRGITLREVNQTGRDISDDLKTTITSSQSFSINSGEGNYLEIKSGGTLVGGRLCLGNYSYIWNYGRGASSPDRTTLTEALTSSSGKEIYMIKVNDTSKKYCSVNSSTKTPVYDQVEKADAQAGEDLLRQGDRQLSMHGFSLANYAKDSVTGQQLYEISFTIGAGDIKTMNSDQSKCLLPSDSFDTSEGYYSDLTYCVIQKFTIVIRAGSRV